MDRLANSFSVNRAFGIRKKENWSDSSALKYSKSAIIFSYSSTSKSQFAALPVPWHISSNTKLND